MAKVFDETKINSSFDVRIWSWRLKRDCLWKGEKFKFVIPPSLHTATAAWRIPGADYRFEISIKVLKPSELTGQQEKIHEKEETDRALKSLIKA